jgi:nicotinate-nucleotide pyrophosphorylase (carboxylating)
MFLPRKILEEKLLRILAEDVGQGDVTTALVVPASTTVEAEIVAKESGTVAGVEETRVLLECLELEAEALVNDGDNVKPKQTLFRIVGDARTILSAERTMLNLFSRMSGIATTTRELVEKIRKAKLKTRVACTRKTAPGLLYFDKKAVLVGGGDTHRLHLDDMVLIKDNHFAIAGNIGKTVQRAREGVSFSKKIEVEITRVDDVLIAAEAGADVVLLDNFSPKQVENACRLLKKVQLSRKALLEASGGITSETVLRFASTGVDIVSLGEMTDNPRPLDMSLEVSKVGKVSRKAQ